MQKVYVIPNVTIFLLVGLNNAILNNCLFFINKIYDRYHKNIDTFTRLNNYFFLFK